MEVTRYGNDAIHPASPPSGYRPRIGYGVTFLRRYDGCVEAYYRGIDEGGGSAVSRDDVVWMAFEEGDDVGDGAFVEELYALGGLVGEVGCKDDLIASQDGMIGREGFLGEDVEAGAGEVS